MRFHIYILAMFIITAIVIGSSPRALASSDGYKKASKYMVASNRKKHPAPKGQDRAPASAKKSKKGKKKNQKRDVASTKKSKSKKKSQKRKVASTKKAKSKKKKKKAI